MLAGILHGERDLRLETTEQPQPGPGEVLLRVLRVGICGSDVHYYRHGRCGPFVPSRPFILGHEFVAIVDSVGPDVKQTSPGERVVVNPARSCGRCEDCTSGRGNLCRHVVMLGSGSTTPPTNGAYAEYVKVQAHQCHSIPDSMDDGIAAMMEPLSVALHAIRRAGDLVGQRVLVTGGGPIGLLTAVAAQSFGASVVAVSEPSRQRRDTAAAMGADHVLDPTSDGMIEHAIGLSDGGFDKVFEASGAEPAVLGAMQMVRRGGTIVQIGTVGNNHITLPVNDIMLREISLLGTFRYADEFTTAIRLAASQRIEKLPQFITGVYPLKEIQQAMSRASDGDDALKVQMSVGD
ncbi:Sorbitol dehydrogenase [Novipirellula aureliae]|uniref:Sorbitol dehydrogenase n=1 Tax=Novipirellula aureliae TaxID=2527966 RepID=A0A5C6DVL2_9BACT|nr:L-idonate 5-dehydrogenase [Novipirellula aureliae]TWU39126.1 Sorbitol dehydrogenase [Novipirellula aureliae]